MLMSYENQIKLEIRFRKNLAKLKGSAVRIKSKKPNGKKTMKEKKKKGIVASGFEHSCTPTSSGEKVRPLTTGPCDQRADFSMEINSVEVFSSAIHTV